MRYAKRGAEIVVGDGIEVEPCGPAIRIRVALTGINDGGVLEQVDAHITHGSGRKAYRNRRNTARVVAAASRDYCERQEH
jgi:hypothetical protein